MSNIEERLQKSIERTNKLKALHAKKMAAARHSLSVKSRRERDRLIYTLGGMVEKMGLDQVPEDVLLGSLFVINKQLANTGFVEQAINKGREYLPVGNKLDRVQVASHEANT